MYPENDILEDPETLEEYLQDNRLQSYEDLEVKCPECGSESIACFMIVPVRYGIRRIVKTVPGRKGKGTPNGIVVLLGGVQLYYDEELEMFRCQDCDAEWKDMFLGVTDFDPYSHNGKRIPAGDLFESDAINNLKTKKGDEK